MICFSTRIILNEVPCTRKIALFFNPFIFKHIPRAISKMSTSSSTKRSLSTDSEASVRSPKRVHLSETCQWINREQTWRDWRDGNARAPILWIHGAPGCGKTFLAHHIINELEELRDKPTIVTSLGVDPSPATSITDRILDCLLMHPDLDEDSRKMFQERYVSIPYGPDRLFLQWDYVPTLLEKNLNVTVVIDDLDETFKKNQGFSVPARLRDLAIQHPSQFKLLVFSRTESFIRDFYKEFPNIRITPEMVDDDLEQFIKSELEQYPTRLAPVSEELVGPIKMQSNGNFLWAELCIKDLDERSVEGETPTLEDVPLSFDDFYARMLEKTTRELGPDEIDLRNTILKWLITPIRPFKEDELANVFMIETNQLFNNGTLGAKPEHVCGGLVQYHVWSGISPAHYMVKNFLQGSHPSLQQIPDIEAKKAHASLACVCLKYLSHPVFDRSIEKTQINLREELGGHYSFLEYASLYWIYHVSHAEKSEELRSMIKSFFTTKNAFNWADTFLAMFLQRSVIQPPPRPANVSHFICLFTLKSQLVNFFQGQEKIDFAAQIEAFLAEAYQQALKDERERIPMQEDKVVGRLLDLAEFYGWLPIWKFDGLSLLEEAVTRASEVDDSIEIWEYIDARQGLADYYKREGRYEEARGVLEELIAKAEGVTELEPNSKRIMFAHDSLGWVCMRLGRLDEAAEHLQRALQIAVERFGSTSSHTLRSKITLAEVLNKLGKSEEAEGLCKELKAQLNDHRQIGTALPKDSIFQLNTLAAIYMQQTKIDEAIETYSAVVDDRKKVFGDEHRMTIWATMQLGIAKQSGGALEEAKELFEALLPKQIKALSETHPDVKETEKRLETLRAKLPAQS